MKIRPNLRHEAELKDLVCKIESENADLNPDGEYTVAGILNVFAKGILESKPDVEKIGYKAVPMFQTDSGTVVWELVSNKDFASHSGDYLDPIPFSAGDEIKSGLFYTDGDDIWESIKNGIPTSFNDKEYFDVI